MNQHADVLASLTSEHYQAEQGRPSDLEYVLERARDAGVSHVISLCEDLHHALNVLKLSRAAEGVYCTVSLDPGVFSERGTRGSYLKEVRRLVRTCRGLVVGVSFSGLRNYKSTSLVRRLRRALGVAVEQQLPTFLKWEKNRVFKLTSVIEDLLLLLPTIIIHSFEGSQQEAQMLLDKGFYLGISCRSVMIPHTIEALTKLPLSKVLVHSGKPELSYLNDHTLVRTRFPAAPLTAWRPGLMLEGRGEPACVTQAVEVMAARRGEEPADVAAQLWTNAREIFFPQEDTCTGVC